MNVQIEAFKVIPFGSAGDPEGVAKDFWSFMRETWEKRVSEGWTEIGTEALFMLDGANGIMLGADNYKGLRSDFFAAKAKRIKPNYVLFASLANVTADRAKRAALVIEVIQSDGEVAFTLLQFYNIREEKVVWDSVCLPGANPVVLGDVTVNHIVGLSQNLIPAWKAPENLSTGPIL